MCPVIFCDYNTTFFASCGLACEENILTKRNAYFLPKHIKLEFVLDSLENFINILQKRRNFFDAFGVHTLYGATYPPIREAFIGHHTKERYIHVPLCSWKGILDGIKTVATKLLKDSGNELRFLIVLICVRKKGNGQEMRLLIIDRCNVSQQRWGWNFGDISTLAGYKSDMVSVCGVCEWMNLRDVVYNKAQTVPKHVCWHCVPIIPE